MAINVDTVYKTVLLILNKEQRGYMTPDEFNKIGTQVQRELFEKCFEDLNQQVRVPQTDMDYADRVAATDEKIAEFKTESDQLIAEKAIGVTNPVSNTFTVPSELYKLGSVTYEPSSNIYPEIQRLGRSEFYNIRKAPLTTPTKDFPVYLYEDNKCIIYPKDITNVDDIKMQYVKKPNDIRWGYYVGSQGQYIFDTSPFISTGFPLQSGYFLNSLVQNFAAENQTSTTPIEYVGLTANSPGISYVGNGSGLVFDMTVDTSGLISELNVTSSGLGYAVDDYITISSSEYQIPQNAGGIDGLINVQSNSIYSGTTFGNIEFGLHTSEQTETILNILLYAGIVIRDPQIVQAAQNELQQDKINEKS